MFFTYLLSAIVILAALCTAIYFIVADAIEKKAEACLFKYFHSTKLLETYNISVDLSNINYSTEECQSYVDRARKKTLIFINSMDISKCMQEQFKQPDVFEGLMLKGVLERYDRDSSTVVRQIFGSAQRNCANQTQTPLIEKN